MERRQFGRRQSATAGWIRIPGRPRLACRVVGLTSKGALLELPVPAWLPFQFELFIEPGNAQHRCEIRHAGPERLGVFFIDFANAAPARRKADEIEDWMGRKPKS